MKKQNLIILIVFICLVSVVFSKTWAFGKKEYHIEAGHEALINHPEFVSIEYINTNEHDMGVYYIVNLTDGRKIEFNYIDTNTGGGIFGGVESIGNYRFTGVSAYKMTIRNIGKNFSANTISIMAIMLLSLTVILKNGDKCIMGWLYLFII